MSTRSAAELYEDDFFAWTQLQAKELRRFARTRPNLSLDLPHIAEEIADLGTELRSRLPSWTRRIVEHLLLLEIPPPKSRGAAGPPRSSIFAAKSRIASRPYCTAI